MLNDMFMPSLILAASIQFMENIEKNQYLEWFDEVEKSALQQQIYYNIF